MKQKQCVLGGYVQLNATTVTRYDSEWKAISSTSYCTEERANKKFKEMSFDRRSLGNAKKHNYKVTCKGDKI